MLIFWTKMVFFSENGFTVLTFTNLTGMVITVSADIFSYPKAMPNLHADDIALVHPDKSISPVSRDRCRLKI